MTFTLLALLALGVVGFVRGNWAERINLNGTVQTARIDVKWVSGICGDFDVKGKDFVGDTDIILGADKVSIVTSNGYPGYSAKCNVRLSNNGTLPLEIGYLRIKAGQNLTNCVFGPALPSTTYASMDCTQLFADIVDGNQQIDPGTLDAFSITLAVKKGAVQQTKYGFQIQICLEPLNSSQCLAKA